MGRRFLAMSGAVLLVGAVLAAADFWEETEFTAWTPTCVVIHTNGLRAWQGTGFLRSELSSGREYDGGGCASRLPYISLTGVESGEQECTRVQCATASERR